MAREQKFSRTIATTKVTYIVGTVTENFEVDKSEPKEIILAGEIDRTSVRDILQKQHGEDAIIIITSDETLTNKYEITLQRFLEVATKVVDKPSEETKEETKEESK